MIENQYAYELFSAVKGYEKGTVLAISKEVAQKIIKEKKYGTLISLRRSGLMYAFLYKIKAIFFQRFEYKLTRRDLIIITEELKVFIEAGFTIVEAIQSLKKIFRKRAIQRMLNQIEKDIKLGKTFSQAISKFPKSIPSSYVAAVKSGETSGHLSDIFDEIIKILEWEDRTLVKFKVAIILPITMVVLLSAISYFLMFFIIPKIVPFFIKGRRELPIIVHTIIQIKTFLESNSMNLKIGGIVVMGGGIGLFLTQKGRLILDKIILRTPIIGHIYKTYILMYFSKQLYVMLKNDVKIIESLQISSLLFKGGIYQQELQRMIQEVRRGRSLGDSLFGSKFFPEYIVELIASGEKTNSLVQKLELVGTILSNRIERLSNLIISNIEYVYLAMMVSYILILLYGFYIPMLRVAMPR